MHPELRVMPLKEFWMDVNIYEYREDQYVNRSRLYVQDLPFWVTSTEVSHRATPRVINGDHNVRYFLCKSSNDTDEPKINMLLGHALGEAWVF